MRPPRSDWMSLQAKVIVGKVLQPLLCLAIGMLVFLPVFESSLFFLLLPEGNAVMVEQRSCFSSGGE